jgi:hypothetical protein
MARTIASRPVDFSVRRLETRTFFARRRRLRRRDSIDAERPFAAVATRFPRLLRRKLRKGSDPPRKRSMLP